MGTQPQLSTSQLHTMSQLTMRPQCTSTAMPLLTTTLAPPSSRTRTGTAMPPPESTVSPFPTVAPRLCPTALPTDTPDTLLMSDTKERPTTIQLQLHTTQLQLSRPPLQPN